MARLIDKVVEKSRKKLYKAGSLEKVVLILISLTTTALGTYLSWYSEWNIPMTIIYESLVIVVVSCCIVRWCQVVRETVIGEVSFLIPLLLKSSQDHTQEESLVKAIRVLSADQRNREDVLRLFGILKDDALIIEATDILRKAGMTTTNYNNDDRQGDS